MNYGCVCVCGSLPSPPERNHMGEQSEVVGEVFNNGGETMCSITLHRTHVKEIGL
jgi:hypothetical protein